MTSSDQRVRQTFAALAGTLVTDFDVQDYLATVTERCADLLEVAAAGLLLADHRGTLTLVAASTEQPGLLDLFRLQDREGPCRDCLSGGEAVLCGDIGADAGRWPRFAAATSDAGFAAVHALPMRLRDRTVGGLNLFGRARGAPGPDAVALAQAFADVAIIGILHERTRVDHGRTVGELAATLDRRAALEQAKGMLAEHLGTTVDSAYQRLRRYADRTGRSLGELARAVVEGRTDLTRVAAG